MPLFYVKYTIPLLYFEPLTKKHLTSAVLACIFIGGTFLL